MSIFGELTRKIIDHPKEHAELYKLAVDAMRENQELLEKQDGMREEIEKFKARVAELERKADRERELVRAEGLLFRVAADHSGLEQEPYCLQCWENEEKLIRLGHREDVAEHVCPACARQGIAIRSSVQRVEEQRKIAARVLEQRDAAGS